jgi:hypothetical protein
LLLSLNAQTSSNRDPSRPVERNDQLCTMLISPSQAWSDHPQCHCRPTDTPHLRLGAGTCLIQPGSPHTARHLSGKCKALTRSCSRRAPSKTRMCPDRVHSDCVRSFHGTNTCTPGQKCMWSRVHHMPHARTRMCFCTLMKQFACGTATTSLSRAACRWVCQPALPSYTPDGFHNCCQHCMQTRITTDQLLAAPGSTEWATYFVPLLPCADGW